MYVGNISCGNFNCRRDQETELLLDSTVCKPAEVGDRTCHLESQRREQCLQQASFRPKLTASGSLHKIVRGIFMGIILPITFKI